MRRQQRGGGEGWRAEGEGGESEGYVKEVGRRNRKKVDCRRKRLTMGEEETEIDI